MYSAPIRVGSLPAWIEKVSLGAILPQATGDRPKKLPVVRPVVKVGCAERRQRVGAGLHEELEQPFGLLDRDLGVAEIGVVVMVEGDRVALRTARAR